jgi:hypothetical protein
MYGAAPAQDHLHQCFQQDAGRMFRLQSKLLCKCGCRRGLRSVTLELQQRPFEIPMGRSERAEKWQDEVERRFSPDDQWDANKGRLETD